MQKNKSEYAGGFVVLAIVLILGVSIIQSPALIGRLIVGMGIGYVLVRAAYGFAGTANRAINAGSTQLMRAFMVLVVLASLVTVAVNAVPIDMINPEFQINYGLFINPISIGAFIGATVFGIGMSFAGGCASGVLTDLTSFFPKAALGLFFFGLGRILGAPLGARFSDLINTSLFTSGPETQGVWFPELFKFDGFNGFLGAMVLNIVLALIVTKLSLMYEEKRKAEGTYTPVDSEVEAEEALAPSLREGQSWYERIFVRPWTLLEGAVGMAFMYALLMAFTKSPWGVSGAFDFWVGKILSLFVGKDAIHEFTGKPELLNPGILSMPVSVQDIGIILGGVIALLTMGKFVKTFTDGLKISPLQAILACIGGLLMGFGTIFARGCNAGGLFSPIVSFSLSGWFFLVFMVLGAIIGNKIIKALE